MPGCRSSSSSARSRSSSGGSSSARTRATGGRHGRPGDGRRSAARRWPCRGGASARPASLALPMGATVRDLELDLDAFEGPFDLLLTLVLREELRPAEVDIAEIVVAFCERLALRDELDLDAGGEFLV